MKSIEDSVNDANGKSIFMIVAFTVLAFTAVNHYAQIQNTLLSIYTPEYECIDPRISNFSDKCVISTYNNSTNVTSSVKCNNWNFSKEPIGETLISEFQLVCDKSYLSELTIILWYVMALTGLIMGWLSDKYGRKKILLFNLLIETASSIFLALSPNIYFNLMCRVILGIGSSGLYIAMVWLMEIVDSNSRDFVGSIFPIFGCLASTLQPIIVYLSQNWRYSQLYMMIPSISYLFIFFIPESPRWLFINGKKQQARHALNYIAKINGVKEEIFNMQQITAVNKTEDVEPLRKISFVRVSEIISEITLNKPNKNGVLLSIVLTFFLQYVIYLFYSAALINIEMLSKNIFISMCFVAFMEIPGLIISYFILHKMTRKLSILIFGITGSLLFLICGLFDRDILWQCTIRIILGSIAMICLVCSDQVSVVYICELFPTSIRTVSFVVVQLADVLAFITSIYINKLEHVFYLLPMIIYTSLMIVSCIVILHILPETKDKPLPDVIQL